MSGNNLSSGTQFSFTTSFTTDFLPPVLLASSPQDGALLPSDESTNNITILVERAAVEAVYTPEEYFALKKAKEETRKKPAKKESTELSQEETMGDFYFETHSYIAAAQHYKLAAKQFPDSERIRKKFVVATINVGIQHIKKREYPSALVPKGR